MKRVLKIVLNVLAWVLLIFALLITIIVFSSDRNNGVANLFGFIPLTVESPSMEPTFKVDDLIICREVDDIYTLEKGDVITFWTIIDGKRVKNTHRIVEINEAENSRSFVTRGDNNGLDDDMPAYAGDVIGKWTGARLPGFGKVMRFLSTKTGFFVCIIIPMALFFLFELYKFIVTLMEVRKPKLTESDEEEIKRKAIEEYLASQNGGKLPGGDDAGADAPAPETGKTEDDAGADAPATDTGENKDAQEKDEADNAPEKQEDAEK
ncbi:MAG: signal peptidase I [Ruminococcus sp.]|nr:signal peptidase I [Ruminococcus sp.]